MRVLLAEDEKELSNALAAILKHNNYSVDAVYDGADALKCGLYKSYDVIILDIMMPKMNGLETLGNLRKEGIHTPILMLTAKAEIEDRILGLNTGADDYLSKPFAMGELLARVHAMTRRKSEFTPSLIKVGNISLNKENYELSSKKSSLRLGNKEFQMLEMLMNNPKCLISTEQFMERIWGYDEEAEINVVLVYISYLRKKLSSLGANVKINSGRDSFYILEEIK
ncbi:response regulator transcription factor [Clostridium coskatii]|uniref:Stage 0 sporulation protein A homolog n=1 Tax=Clostridium coskatii TaxID=1705578 RepID=A0A168QND1_9CLOT|nr:response regulator transcription factor [Clostridium coskatii]OAA89383.1 Response regulator ArlR [Clostridium coskatii]OBR92384.1 response regulator ArlR [Clostridium coskatii]